MPFTWQLVGDGSVSCPGGNGVGDATIEVPDGCGGLRVDPLMPAIAGEIIVV